MRTTLTLDDDVAAKLKVEIRRSGRSFKQAVNDALRRGLTGRAESTPRRPFKVEARDMGRLRAGLSLDNVAEILDQAEGPSHR